MVDLDKRTDSLLQYTPPWSESSTCELYVVVTHDGGGDDGDAGAEDEGKGVKCNVGESLVILMTKYEDTQCSGCSGVSY